MSRVLVTGANGYIGKHILSKLGNGPHDVYGIDNNIRSHNSITLLDIRDLEALKMFIKKFSIEIVVNCAGLKSVAESFTRKEDYFAVNTTAITNLVEIAQESTLTYIIQASSAAVYGEQLQVYMKEDLPLNPISPYGESKMKAEEILQDAMKRGIVKSTSLRYFNVVGSESKSMQDSGKSNLFPIVRDCIIEKKIFEVFGSNYLTKDGTCERDFIHVQDVAAANLAMINGSAATEYPSVLNLGSGRSYSVLDVYNEFQDALNQETKIAYKAPRLGDSPIVIADIKLAQHYFDYFTFKSFREMVSSSI
jgi:UDP-glucose 4-epimerase